MNRVTVYSMPRNNPNERFSVSLPAELAEALRDVANRQFHGNISAAITEAIKGWTSREAIRARGLASMRDYQAEHGDFTAGERAAARAEIAEMMGWDADRPGQRQDETA
jgi:Arc/MetJ-type ribon-helix-helix transcriptional regulator